MGCYRIKWVGSRRAAKTYQNNTKSNETLHIRKQHMKLKIDKNGFKKCNIKLILISSKNDRIYHVDSV